MARRSMKSALGSSLDAESQAFQSRLSRADRALDHSSPVAEVAAEPKNEPVAETVMEPAIVEEPIAKVVREAFTLPENEQQQIEVIRERALQQAIYATKSEVMRAGLLLVSELDDQQLRQLLERVEKVRTGRPKLSN